jgi:hypothetical protein
VQHRASSPQTGTQIHSSAASHGWFF